MESANLAASNEDEAAEAAAVSVAAPDILQRVADAAEVRRRDVAAMHTHTCTQGSFRS